MPTVFEKTAHASRYINKNIMTLQNNMLRKSLGLNPSTTSHIIYALLLTLPPPESILLGSKGTFKDEDF